MTQLSTRVAYGAAAALLAVTAVGLLQYGHPSMVRTASGEQRVLHLEDGSQVTLNAATRIVVSHDGERRVTLQQGEALFNVTKVPDKPFIATAGPHRIEAPGSAIFLLKGGGQLAVTLLEGRISLSSDPTRRDKSEAAHQANEPNIVLQPGERVVFSKEHPLKRDYPRLDELLAWRRSALDPGINGAERHRQP